MKSERVTGSYWNVDEIPAEEFAKEVERLEAQHRSLLERYPIDWQFIAEEAFRMDAEWLDVGCGSGPTVRSWARMSSGTIVAVGAEYSKSFVRAAYELAKAEGLGLLLDSDRLKFCQTRAESLVEEFGEERFSLIHTRLMLIHSSHPQQVLEQFLRIIKPGGIVVLEEIDRDLEYLVPADSVWQDICRRSIAGQKCSGGSPCIGKELGPLLDMLGFKDISVDVRVCGKPVREKMFGSCVPNFLPQDERPAARAEIERIKRESVKSCSWNYDVLFRVTARAPR